MALVEFGATAWGRAWLRTVERIDRGPNPKLPKARSLGRSEDISLSIDGATLAARVRDGRAEHTVGIVLPPWTPAQQQTDAAILDPHMGDAAVGDLPDVLVEELTRRVLRLPCRPRRARQPAHVGRVHIPASMFLRASMR